jgi:hypothetical protein
VEAALDLEMNVMNQYQNDEIRYTISLTVVDHSNITSLYQTEEHNQQ